MSEAPPVPTRPRRVRLRTKVLLSVVVGLVVLEVGLRVIDRMAGRGTRFWLPPASTENELFDKHPYMGFLYRPGATRARAPDGSGQEVRINAHGMRGEELAQPKPPGTYRIFCVGGSTTFGTSVTEDEKSYPERLEHYLNARAPDGVTYEVANCGVNGYNSVETLINFELRLVELEPDAVIVYHAANDARPIQARGFRPDYSHMRRSWTDVQLSPVERFLLRWWRTYCWATRGIDPDEQLGNLSNPIFVPDFQELHVPSDQRVNEEGVEVFLRNLRHLALVARARGIEPVFSTFAACPAKRRDPRERFVETVDAINARLPAFCEELGVPLLRIAEHLGADPALPPEVQAKRCEWFTDWMHLDDAGSDEHGRIACEEAARLGLFGL